MKKQLLLPGALALATVAGIVPVGAVPVGAEPVEAPIVETVSTRTNLLRNPGFEDGLTGWTKLNRSGFGTLSITDEPHSGTSAALFRGSSIAVSFVQFDNPLPTTAAGTRYSVGVWAALSTEQPSLIDPFGEGFILPGDLVLPEEFILPELEREPEPATITLATWTDGDELPRVAASSVSEELTTKWVFHTLTFELDADGYDRTYPEIYLNATNTNYVFDDMVLIEGEFTPPSKPGNVTVEADLTSASVSWDASTVDWDSGEAEASDVTHYVVTAVPTAAARLLAEPVVETEVACETDALSCTVEGLEPGTEYLFTVVAHNAIGGGDAGTATASTLDDTTIDPGEQEIDELAPLRRVQAEREQAGQAMTTGHGITARLYWAVLGRAPEAGGARFWFEAYDSGEWDLRRIAAHFATSEEFRTRFGTDLTNAEFAELVYTNALGRAPDSSGLTFWIGQLDDGMARSEMVLLVSDSPEFRVSHPVPWES